MAFAGFDISIYPGDSRSEHSLHRQRFDQQDGAEAVQRMSGAWFQDGSVVYDRRAMRGSTACGLTQGRRR
jgi:hypothetical protein